MKSFTKILVLAVLAMMGCDSGAICVYANKDVTVFNNTAYDLDVIIKNNFNAFQIGTMQAFEIDVFSVQHSLIIEAGTINFSNQLFVDPCRQTLELIVED